MSVGLGAGGGELVSWVFSEGPAICKQASNKSHACRFSICFFLYCPQQPLFDVLWLRKPAFERCYAFGDGAQNEQTRLRVPAKFHVRWWLWLCAGGVCLGAPRTSTGAGGNLVIPCCVFQWVKIFKEFLTISRTSLPHWHAPLLSPLSPLDGFTVLLFKVIPRFSMKVFYSSWALGSRFLGGCSGDRNPEHCSRICYVGFWWVPLQRMRGI